MSDGHTTATHKNYTVTFHPAFASRCVVKGEDGECEIYRQNGPHHFKNGDKHPKKHTITLKGGKWDRDICMEVDDPNQAVAFITVAFYGDGHVPGAGEGDPAVEYFTIYNDGTTCPPTCGPSGLL